MVESVYEDSHLSVVSVALRGENRRAINHLSTTTYQVLSGLALFEVNGEHFTLRKGEMLAIPAGTPYQDTGSADMLATSVPPFNQYFVEYLD